MKGIGAPLRAIRGRVQTLSDAEQNANVIRIAVMDGTSDHPFERDRGISSPVFSMATVQTAALLRRAASRNLRRLEGEGRISVKSLDSSMFGAEAHVYVRYVDLEESATRDLAVKVL